MKGSISEKEGEGEKIALKEVFCVKEKLFLEMAYLHPPHAKNVKRVHRFRLRQIPIDRRRFQQRDNEYIGVESRRRDPASSLLIVGLEEIR